MFSKVLLTNDDSHRSPLLEFIIHYLKSRTEQLKIVVPAREQSWRGKMITRYDPLHTEEAELFGCPATYLDGSPADCANYGVYHAFEGQKPDLVVSGINAGLNSGIGFILSSGTVGACFEANIAGVPAVALSQEFTDALRISYASEYKLPEDEQERLSEQTEICLKLVFDSLTEEMLSEQRTTWNANFPHRLELPGILSRTRVGNTFYGSLFTHKEGAIKHSLLDIERDHSEDTDLAALRRGEVSLTRLNIEQFFAAGH